jgi:(p)ppGpp synthase/HD superfamily hydrolase
MLIEIFNDLIKLAENRGYNNEDIELIKSAYIIASEYSKNRFRYRIKDRPFINHLISTCSLLINLNLNIETVVAGLLHSVKNDMNKIYSLNHTVGEIVNNYYDITIKNDKRETFDKTNSIEWAVITIQMANYTDMVISGEIII